MQVYKRSLWVMVKGLILAVFAGFAGYFITGFFTQDLRLIYGIPAALFLILTWLALVSENIRFELEPGGQLRYFKRGRLKHSCQLKNCGAGYRQRSENGIFGSHDITLNLVDMETAQQTSLDCSPLGPSRFERMFRAIEGHTATQPEVLRAEPDE